MAVHFGEIVQIRGTYVHFEDLLQPHAMISVELSGAGNKFQRDELVVRLPHDSHAEIPGGFIVKRRGEGRTLQAIEYFRHRFSFFRRQAAVCPVYTQYYTTDCIFVKTFPPLRENSEKLRAFPEKKSPSAKGKGRKCGIL